MNTAMRRIQVGNGLGALGPGLTLPLVYVYVSQVRGLGALDAGLVLTMFAVAALVLLPFAGKVIVRRGPLPVLLAALIAAAAGSVGMGFATGPAAMLLWAAALGAGQAVMQPAMATMIVDCSTAQTRSRAFATQFFLLNVGIGIGGLLAGHLVDTARVATFTRLFAISAATYLVAAAVLATVRMPAAPRITDVAGVAGTGRGSWRRLLGDRAMVRLCVLGFVLFFAFYGQFESGLSAYGLQVVKVSPATLGTALAVNTAAIIVAQFAVLRLTERRRRTRVIAAVGLLWAVAWGVAGYAGLIGGNQGATVAFLSAYVLFGLGEAMLSPTLGPLVADVAPEGLAGQYNSAFSLVKELALAIGPAVGGPLGALLPFPYIAALVLVSASITVLALRTGRHLTTAQNQPRAAEPVAV